MRTVNVRELRNAIPTLKETLAAEGELLLLSNGEPIARVLPVTSERRRLKSLKAFRELQPAAPTPVEQLVREERDRR